MNRILLFTLLTYSAVCFAHYSDERLYEAFLRQDMSEWKAYIDDTSWDTISVEERLRLLNYEYGYIAAVIEQPDSQVEKYLAAFRAHVDEEYRRHHISEARYCMYMSSIHAYDFMLNKSRLFSSGLQSFKLVKKAVELDPDDPFVLTLKANVDFYAPSAFGGDKEEALRMFTRARELFKETVDYTHLWNYASLRMCIAQCYEKTGDRQRAIAECRDILQDIPDFSYIRDTYLPALLAYDHQ